jgi:hypothetical protein
MASIVHPDSASTLRRDTKAGAMQRTRFGAVEIVTLFLYAGLLIWAFPHHEPCPDEAQAWQLARTLPFAQMFRLLSYEGHPGLWYVLLWALSRLHVSYTGMCCVAAVIAFAGITLLVSTSPFPRFVKLLLPFSFYLAFQYAHSEFQAQACATNPICRRDCGLCGSIRPFPPSLK